MPSNLQSLERVERLHGVIDALRAASETPTKQRKQKVSLLIDEICNHAFQEGLDRTALDAIVGVVSKKTELDQSSVTTLIKNLYPAEKVPNNIVIALVSGLGQGKEKPSSATQSALVKWLVNVFEVLEHSSILSRLYSVLFSLLDMISIRTSVCQLLTLITRRKHVRPFRIQQLLELSRMAGNDPAVFGLLRVYKDYYPDIIIGSAMSGRTSASMRPDPEWRQRLQNIQEANSFKLEVGLGQQNGFKVARRGAKRSKVSIVPEVHTSHANESSVTLEEIDSVESFVNRLERIDLPNQLISSLKDPLLQKYLMLNPSDIASKRIELWLSRYLEEELDSAQHGSGASAHLIDILEGSVLYAQNTKSFPPVVESFLKDYLPVWDGNLAVDSILTLVARLRIRPFTDFHTAFLSPVEHGLLSQNKDPYQRLLYLYTDIARQWTTAVSASTNSGGPQAGPILSQCLLDLAEHAAKAIISCLSTLPAGSTETSAVLSFYEMLSASAAESIVSGGSVVPIILPPPLVVYSLSFSASSCTISRLSAILANYKHAFDSLKPPIHDHYPADVTNRFNGYLMDICNLLWRSRALSTSDRNSMGCLCPEEITAALQAYFGGREPEYNISSAFGLSHSHVLCAISIAMVRYLEEKAETSGDELRSRHSGPVTQRTLVVLSKEGGLELAWKQYRVQVLNWLEGRGLAGIKRLMYATMTGLREGSG